MRISLAVLTLVLAGAEAWGQSAAGAAAAQAGGRVISREVSADRRVTFRLSAPNAKEVVVTGEAGRFAMQKDARGVWTATTPPLEPDIYSYSFLVDGATFQDPGNPLRKPAYEAGGQSLVRVPGPVIWEPADVPRGAVTRHFFKSAVVGDDRDLYVYTPPGYNPRGRTAYPVLYLLHGHGDEAAGWIATGSANVILDNLIARGEARPMIVAAPLGYGAREMMQGLATGRGGGPEMMEKNVELFAKSLVEEVIPLVEKRYNVSRKREERAIAGLSMGGAQALFAGLNHLDRFAWVASFSGAFMMWSNAWWSRPPPPPPGGGRPAPMPLEADVFPMKFPALDSRANAQLRLLWISCGTEDRMMVVNRQFWEYLKSKGIQLKEVEHPGGHTWAVWRRNLAELAPLLFQAKGR